MCTLSWFSGADGYELFFNRDERRHRRPAEPPAVGRARETRFVAPRDGDAGGTWLAVNERGLALALLNGYAGDDDERREPPGGFETRGLLPLALIDAAGVGEVAQRVAAQRPERFRSFLLAAFAPGDEALLVRWARGRLETAGRLDPALPLVSSSFDTDEVRRGRTELFRSMGRAHGGDRAALHLAYHASHLPARGPYSVCMHRPDALTVSFSRVVVGPAEVRFDYSPDSPCRERHAARAALPRRNAPQ